MAYHSPTALSRNFVKICNQAFGNCSRMLVNPGKFTLKSAGGFGYDTFNPRAQPSVWSIIRIIEMSRAFGFFGDPKKYGASFLDIDNIDGLLYAISMTLSCESELYNPVVEKQPVYLENELVQVGNTSFKVRGKMFLPKVQKPVAEKNFQIVLVDKDTRRPVAFPSWWKDKYGQYSLPGENRLHVDSFDFNKCDGNIHTIDLCVQSSDLDCYCHMNNVFFVKFCYEAYLISHVRQFGYTGAGDPFRNVKNLACTFKGEAGLGDSLKVFVAQDPSNVDTYHFKINKNTDDQTLFECSMQFYPQIVAKL